MRATAGCFACFGAAVCAGAVCLGAAAGLTAGFAAGLAADLAGGFGAAFCATAGAATSNDNRMAAAGLIVLPASQEVASLMQFSRRTNRLMRGTFTLLVLAPGRDRGGATHHRPFVVIHIDQREAGRLAALPARAEAILVELPRSLAFDTGGATHRLARHLAVG